MPPNPTSTDSSTRAADLAKRQEVIQTQMDSLAENFHKRLDFLFAENKHLSNHVDAKFDHLERQITASQKQFETLTSTITALRKQVSSSIPAAQSLDTPDSTSQNRQVSSDINSDIKPAAVLTEEDLLRSSNVRVRLPSPPSFSGSERPRTDPRDHVFNLNLWLGTIPEHQKLSYAANTLLGVARKEWRTRSASAPQSYATFCNWLVQRFEIVDISEKARQKIRDAIQSGRYSNLDAYCELFINAQADLGLNHDEELISPFIAVLRLEAAANELRIRRPSSLSEAIRIAQSLRSKTGSVQSRIRPDRHPPTSRGIPSPTSSAQHANSASLSSDTSKSKLTSEERDRINALGGCVYCRKMDHKVTACPTRPKQSRTVHLSTISASCLPSVTQPQATSPDSAALHVVCVKRQQRPWLTHQVSAHSKSVMDAMIPATLLLDTGAETDFVSVQLCQRANIPTRRLSEPQSVTLAIDKTAVVHSEATVTLTLHSNPLITITRVFLVAPINPDLILGTPFLHSCNATLNFSTGAITFSLPPPLDRPVPGLATIQANTMFDDAKSDPDKFHHKDATGMSLVRHFRNTVFRSSLPLRLPPPRDISHEINLLPGTSPVYRKPYRLSPAEQRELRRQIDDYLKAGFLRQSNSPFGAPVLFAKKLDGCLRLCLEYRALIAVTVKDKTPLPHSDDLINHTAGSTIFTKLDLRSAFHQLLIRPSDIPQSAITTIFGNYEWLIMPFGMANSPSSWQAIVNSIFRDLLGDYVVVYLDDILIYSKTRESPTHHVTECWNVFRNINFM